MLTSWVPSLIFMLICIFLWHHWIVVMKTYPCEGMLFDHQKSREHVIWSIYFWVNELLKCMFLKNWSQYKKQGWYIYLRTVVVLLNYPSRIAAIIFFSSVWMTNSFLCESVIDVFSREQILLYITSSHGWLVHTYRCKSFDRFHGAADRSDALILPRPFHLLLTINKQYQYQWIVELSCLFLFIFVCLFVCCLCPTREHFDHVETLPLLVKGYTDLTCARTCGYWAGRDLHRATSTVCGMGSRFCGYIRGNTQILSPFTTC